MCSETVVVVAEEDLKVVGFSFGPGVIFNQRNEKREVGDR